VVENTTTTTTTTTNNNNNNNKRVVFWYFVCVEWIANDYPPQRDDIAQILSPHISIPPDSNLAYVRFITSQDSNFCRAVTAYWVSVA
jgi:hypothetical protein